MATALLDKQEVEEAEAAKGEKGQVLYHWTVDAFHKAYDAGVFGYATRLELIQGRIIEKMPPGPCHSYLADAVAHMLRVALEPPLLVREEKAVRIAFDGQPIPDVTVVRGTRAEYQQKHPTPEDVALLVEVADTSGDYDLGEKALLYAQTGISDYWVVLVNGAALVRHRIPTPEGYQEVARLAGADAISPLELPEVVWTINALLGREEATEEN